MSSARKDPDLIVGASEKLRARAASEFFVRFPAWLSSRRDLSWVEKAVWAYLYTLWYAFGSTAHAAGNDEHAVGRVSFTRMSDELGMDRRNARKITSRLIASGWLKVLSKGHGRTPNVYVLMDPPDASEEYGKLDTSNTAGTGPDPDRVVGANRPLRGVYRPPLRIRSGGYRPPLAADIYKEDSDSRSDPSQDPPGMKTPGEERGESAPFGRPEKGADVKRVPGRKPAKPSMRLVPEPGEKTGGKVKAGKAASMVELREAVGADADAVAASIASGRFTSTTVARAWNLAWAGRLRFLAAEDVGGSGKMWTPQMFGRKELHMAKALIEEYGAGWVDLVRAAVLWWDDVVVAVRRKESTEFFGITETPSFQSLYGRRRAWASKVRQWSEYDRAQMGWIGISVSS